ncbi:MAG TPA: hypothetical protein PKW48_13095, partial [Deltaproteobacteria bacterium]|nr:hypothetical protein [Deltaproteobacteria bacterium]HPX48788.1 hypothetical protein [Deltaproteobacteria bacterium]HQA72899.1 hypothetical protein [Deltaproteobacteria bacterium]HQO81988.1 hypothetical protein [Deltaproteobacteria bacterium]HRR21329.1 hypothetical protein [Desulfomonilia bacterium]
YTLIPNFLKLSSYSLAFINLLMGLLPSYGFLRQDGESMIVRAAFTSAPSLMSIFVQDWCHFGNIRE